MVRGFCFYNGPSQINGAPIVAIATLETTNRKTGDMVQTWMLPQDTAPHDAVRNGADESVCGSCKHRPSVHKKNNTAKCYVETWQAPLQIWRAYRRGLYPLATPELIHRLGYRGLRLGSWGDPAAVPFPFWEPLIEAADFHTGYTHRAGSPEAEPLKGVCMASADSPEHAKDLQRNFWATFRVADRGDKRRFPWEAQCPASREAGAKRRCNNCPIKCDGKTFAAIKGRVIQAH